MKRWVPALLIVAGILVVAGFVVSRAATSQASDTGGGAKVDVRVESQATEGVAFIGISLASISDDEAAEAGLDSGALIARVISGGPADGLLLDGDIVSAVDGRAVADPTDVVDIVRSFQASDVITFTVHRDGASMDVDVTAGAREDLGLTFGGRILPDFMPLEALHPKGQNGLIKSEVKVETDDGVRTVRTAVGTVGDLYIDAGTFFLTLKDGSETIKYEINDDTRITINSNGDLSGLNTDNLTTVVDVQIGDGGWRVESVSQGAHSRFGPGHPGLGLHERFDGFGGRPPGAGFRYFQRLPRDGDRFHNFLPPESADEFFRYLPDELRERFEGFRLTPEDLPAEDEVIIQGTQS